MVKRVLWLTVVFVLLCSGVTLLYVGAFAAAKRSASVPVFTSQEGVEASVTKKKDGGVFPVLVEGTTLVAESLALYEGDMLEEDSDEFLVDAAALELRNFGTREVTMAEITLEFTHTTMVFFATNIPPGGRVLIVEQEGKPWTESNFTNCSGWARYGSGSSLLDDALRIEDVDMGSVLISNTTDQTFHDVWFYYKNYLYDADLYLGGITYVEVVPTLGPGEQIMLLPSRYAMGYSKFVKAEAVG